MVPLHHVVSSRYIHVMFIFLHTVAELKHSPVKRHHSEGNMLSNNHIEYDSPPQVRRRPRRPKSEGSFYVEKFRPKRASSFGVSGNNV